MKLMPASRAFATIRDDVASSVGPPNIMVPRQIGEIFRPLRPSWRYCMGWLLSLLRHCEERSHEAIQLSCRGSGLLRCARNDGGRVSRLILQYLEHAIGHGDRALLHRHF